MSKRLLTYILLTVIGAVGGYLYYRYVGCVTGSCPLTANPYISTVYGGVVGYLIGGVIAPSETKQEKQN